MSVILRKTTDPIFDDTREISKARDAAADSPSFMDEYKLGYKRGYTKAWTAARNRKDWNNG